MLSLALQDSLRQLPSSLLTGPEDCARTVSMVPNLSQIRPKPRPRPAIHSTGWERGLKTCPMHPAGTIPGGQMQDLAARVDGSGKGRDEGLTSESFAEVAKSFGVAIVKRVIVVPEKRRTSYLATFFRPYYPVLPHSFVGVDFVSCWSKDFWTRRKEKCPKYRWRALRGLGQWSHLLSRLVALRGTRRHRQQASGPATRSLVI